MYILRYNSLYNVCIVLVLFSLVVRHADSAPSSRNVTNSAEHSGRNDELFLRTLLDESSSATKITSLDLPGKNIPLNDSTAGGNKNEAFQPSTAEARGRGVGIAALIRLMFSNWLAFVIVVAILGMILTACCHSDFCLDNYLNALPEDEKSRILGPSASPEAVVAKPPEQVSLETNDAMEPARVDGSHHTSGIEEALPRGKAETDV